jgi:hypothetical protein
LKGRVYKIEVLSYPSHDGGGSYCGAGQEVFLDIMDVTDGRNKQVLSKYIESCYFNFLLLQKDMGGLTGVDSKNPLEPIVIRWEEYPVLPPGMKQPENPDEYPDSLFKSRVVATITFDSGVPVYSGPREVGSRNWHAPERKNFDY